MREERIMEKILIRYEGASHEIEYNILDVPENPTDTDIKVAVQRHLELDQGSLDNYEIDRYETQAVIRPQAKFGK